MFLNDKFAVFHVSRASEGKAQKTIALHKENISAYYV